MFIKKTGLFAFIEFGKVDISCDVCSERIEKAEATKTANGSYALLYKGGTSMLCTNCFNRNITSYRLNEFESNRSSEACCICSTNLRDIKFAESNDRIRHICQRCLKFKTHEDNKHNFRHSSINGLWNSCSDCGTLRIHSNGNFTYWRISENKKSTSSSICNKQNINEMLCKHNYIDVADFRKDDKKITSQDVLKADKALKRSLPLLKNDPYPMTTIKSVSIATNGYILQWCNICGNIEKKI